jgi:preprotein translocase subunit YajC
MNNFVFSLLLAAPADGGSGGLSSTLVSFLPIVLIIGIFYMLILRPQNKKQKETQRMLSELKKGDKAVTIGGVHGVVQTVRENTVILKVDESCKIEFTRSAIASVVSGKDKEEGGESAN